MSSAYGSGGSGAPLALGRAKGTLDKDLVPEVIHWTPKRSTDAVEVVFDRYRHERDHDGMYAIFQQVIEEGLTYPQETTSVPEFDAYFLSHDVYVFRTSVNGREEVIAGFYVKPNFPGRSGHIANGGLIVRLDWRGRGLGHHVFGRMVKMAEILGYQAFYTNLVYATNTASARLCAAHGLVQTGRLPAAGRLRGTDSLVDALQFYKKLKETVH